MDCNTGYCENMFLIDGIAESDSMNIATFWYGFIRNFKALSIANASTV